MVGRLVAGDELGEPEVEQLDLIGSAVDGLEEHVSGLEVAVRDALPVRVRERAKHLPKDCPGLFGIERALVDFLVETAPLEHLHHDERAFVGHSEVGHRDDVRMRERRERLGLSLEAHPELVALSVLGEENLDGHRAT